MKIALFTLLMSFSLPAFAGETSQYDASLDSTSEKSYSSFVMGHNLTSTSYTPKKGQLVAGLFSILYGVTNDFMIGTSPWMILGYNMPMVDFKYSGNPRFIFDHASAEVMYFKTAHYGLDAYEQESGWLRLTGTFDVSDFYRAHLCLGTQYFWDDTAPYSMRPPPTNDTPLTLSVSALQELNFTQNLGMFLESGILGLNYPNRYLHLGASTYFKWSGGYVQFGFSRTYRIGPEYLTENLFSHDDWEDRSFRNMHGHIQSNIYYWMPEPIHPEVHIEFLL